MKKVLILTAALLCGNLFFAQPQQSNETYVYVCTGSSSKRFHRTADCKGLTNCKGEVKKITLSAARQAERTPCKLCYPNQ